MRDSLGPWSSFRARGLGRPGIVNIRTRNAGFVWVVSMLQETFQNLDALWHACRRIGACAAMPLEVVVDVRDEGLEGDPKRRLIEVGEVLQMIIGELGRQIAVEATLNNHLADEGPRSSVHSLLRRPIAAERGDDSNLAREGHRFHR